MHRISSTSSLRRYGVHLTHLLSPKEDVKKHKVQFKVMLLLRRAKTQAHCKRQMHVVKRVEMRRRKWNGSLQLFSPVTWCLVSAPQLQRKFNSTTMWRNGIRWAKLFGVQVLITEADNRPKIFFIRNEPKVNDTELNAPTLFAPQVQSTRSFSYI